MRTARPPTKPPQRGPAANPLATAPAGTRGGTERRKGRAIAEAHPPRSPRTPKPGREREERWLYGRHAVTAALANAARHWRRLTVLADELDAATALVKSARAQCLDSTMPVTVLDRAELNQLLPAGAVHQGWALEVEPLPPVELDAVLPSASQDTSRREVVIVLDRVSDPHNVGAVLRSAAGFGARAVIVAEHGAPAVTGVLAKAASGALETVPLVRAVNLSRTLDRLKAAGFWCCGLDARAEAPLATLDLGPRVALVLGAEGGGLRRLIREECDYLARIPTRPEQPSLNVSNAAAVALYELLREPAAG